MSGDWHETIVFVLRVLADCSTYQVSAAVKKHPRSHQRVPSSGPAKGREGFYRRGRKAIPRSRADPIVYVVDSDNNFYVPKFLDLSAQVHSILLERFPELNNPAPYDDPTEKLPMPSITALDWKADALVDLDDTETETDDPDWNDVAILIGSEIVRDVRAAVREHLKYTCVSHPCSKVDRSTTLVCPPSG